MKTDVYWEGEFGYELLVCIPYAYWLHKQGLLGQTSSLKDTSCFYFFNKGNHIERSGPRTNKNDTSKFPVKNIHVPDWNPEKWEMPDYRSQFKNDVFKFEKPHIVICNKYQREWEGPPVNFLDVKTLTWLIEKQEDRGYTVIYNRPSPKHIVGDNSEILDLGEKTVLKEKFPNLIFMEDLVGKHPELTFNTLQLMVMANAEEYVSVQGGSSLLCSLMGKRNVIYAKVGGEVDFNSYKNWYNKLSGCEIWHFKNREDLIA